MMKPVTAQTVKRVTLFSGHYGSGKTNFAVNYALRLREQGFPVTVGDLDIVNPYFRTKDSSAALAAAGVKLVALPYANTNVDLPSVPSEMYGLVQDRSRYAVLDIGGDDRGAVALGRFRDAILTENNYEHLLTVNFLRPLTRTAEEAETVMNEIFLACGIPFTGIVNNTNLGAETTAEIVLASVKEAEKMSERTGLPVVMTGAERRVAETLGKAIPNLVPLVLQKRPTE